MAAEVLRARGALPASGGDGGPLTGPLLTVVALRRALAVSASRTPGAREMRRPRRLGSGTVFATVLLIAFVLIWRKVLAGSAVLIGGDVLYCCPPWNGAAGAHPAANSIVADSVDQFLPWLKLTAQAFAAHRLPLWNPVAMTGKPLLANHQSAPFSPFTWLALLVGDARGYSLAMLAKPWIAGIGMVVFGRLLGVRPLAAGFGALAYATGSFMVVWLAWPHTSVAALLPWVFAAIEWYLRRPGLAPLAAVASSVCLQFLAGHAETSLHLGVGAGIYAVVRCLDGKSGRLRDFAALGLGGALGAAAGAVQLIPFLQELRESSLISDRQGFNTGSEHLPLSALATWVAPNLNGNPAIDHLLGRLPNYNESSGFIGVGALVLAGAGAFRGWTRASASTRALLAVGLVAAGAVYGPLSPLIGRLPGLSASYNVRMLVLLTFVLGALAAVGLEALLERPSRRSPVGSFMLIAGLAALGATIGLAGSFAVFRVRVEGWFPALPGGWIAFWLLVGASSLAAAVSLVAAGWLRGGRAPWIALAALATVEAALFAAPFQPQVPPDQVPPRSETLAWLQAHSSDARVAATGLTLIPETAGLYGLSDARGYDVVRSPRVRAYWSRADPGFRDGALLTVLNEPGADWLAAAGVRYVMTPGDQPLAGTPAVFRGEGVTIGEVPGVRRFAFPAASTACGATAAQAGEMLSAGGPLGPIVLEREGCPAGGPADVRVISHLPERLELSTTASGPTVVVVLQTYTPDWTATVDGRPTSVMAANVLFQAVTVPPGEHRIVLQYQPASVTLGTRVSVLAAFLIAAMAAAGAWQLCRARRSSA